MKKQILFVFFCMKIMQAGTSENSTFKDSFERSLIDANIREIQENYQKLSNFDQYELKRQAELWMCYHFAKRGFSSLEQAINDEKYRNYKCPNVGLCEAIFEFKNGLRTQPTEAFKALRKSSDDICSRVQKKYMLSEEQMTALMEYIKFFIILDGKTIQN